MSAPETYDLRFTRPDAAAAAAEALTRARIGFTFRFVDGDAGQHCFQISGADAAKNWVEVLWMLADGPPLRTRADRSACPTVAP